MTRRGVIGRSGGLPWKLSADLKRFRALTMGHHVILGRKTYESLPGPLPGRTLLVLKRLSSPYDNSIRNEGGQPLSPAFVGNLDAALALAAQDDEPFVIGGGEVYRQALGRVDRLYVTWVEADLAGDTYFPAWNPAEWSLAESTALPADERNEFPTTYCIYDNLRAIS